MVDVYEREERAAIFEFEAGMSRSDAEWRADPPAPVLYNQRVRAWPEHDEGGRARYMPWAEALTSRFAFDAHTTQYSVPSVTRRLDQGAPEKVAGGVAMVRIMFDIDGPKVGDGHRRTPEWWTAELPKLEPIGTFIYPGRGGYRLCYELPEPFYVRTIEDADAWTKTYLLSLAYLKRKYGIVADSKCKDWQRLFRLPHATRDEGGQPEELGTIGDPDRIAVWRPSFEQADADDAFKIAKRPVKIWEPRQYSGGTVDGILPHAFQARGWLGAERKDHWVVRCPWHHEHSKNHDPFDSSTILYRAGPGKEMGWLRCEHTHCENRTTRDVAGMFSEDELRAARVAAGVQAA